MVGRELPLDWLSLGLVVLPVGCAVSPVAAADPEYGLDVCGGVEDWLRKDMASPESPIPPIVIAQTISIFFTFAPRFFVCSRLCRV